MISSFEFKVTGHYGLWAKSMQLSPLKFVTKKYSIYAPHNGARSEVKALISLKKIIIKFYTLYNVCVLIYL